MKSAFLAKLKQRIEVVEIAEFDLKVGIRTLTARERVDWGNTKENSREELLLRSLADPDTGERIFNDGELSLLMDIPDWVLTQLYFMSLRFNKFSDQAINEMTRDFLATPAKSSSST